MRRVAVTGLGAITPLGNDVPSTWQAAVEGRSGIDWIRAFDASEFPVRIAAEVKDFDPTGLASPQEGRPPERNVLRALGAAKEAIGDAGLDSVYDPARVGILFGTAIGGVLGILQQGEVLRERGADRVSPNFLQNVLVDSASGQLAISTGYRGPNYAPVSACATGSHSVGEAAELIRRGDADAARLDVRASQGRAHHLGDALRFRLGLRHVVRVVRAAVAEDLRVHTCAPRLCGLEVLQHEHACALPHDEPGTGRVERPRRARRVLVLDGQAAHRREAGEDQRMHARLAAAREDGVGVAALDDLRRLADRVRARRARRDDGVVQPLDPERDRELPARRVDEHVRQEVRGDAVRPALAEDLVLLEDAGHAADSGAEDDPDARGIEAVQPRVLHRLAPGAEGEQHVALELADLFRRGDLGRVEVLDLRRDPHGQPLGVERADPVDSAPPGDGGLPGGPSVVAERRDGAKAGDSDSLHLAKVTN